MHIKALTAALIFSFLLILPSAYSQDNTTWVYNSEHLTLENEIATKINIEKDGAAAVEYVEAEFSFYPKETPNQKIISKEYSPMPEITPAVVRFRWNSPESDVLPISLKTRLNMVNNPVRITNKIPFPLKDVPEDIQLFTNPAKIIDINQDIRALASQLAQGEDDTSIVVDKIAKWVTENIKYNLDSATAEASQKASWVLQHKEGVCDELTSLFISMVRSLGIPARFVAGIAYTNSDLFVNSWGPHGWAEVYFPGYGWIPYDVTYGQYSFVDPTHIVASIDIDAGKITTKFKIKGKNAELNIDDFTTDTKVTATGKQMSPPITIDARPVKGSVGFGSYNIIFAKIKNKANYYLPIDVYISKTDELEVIDGYKKHILLTPNEEETIYWTVRVSPALEGKYLYTFPVSVYAIGEVSDRKEFKAVKGGITLTEDRVKDTLAKFIKEEQKNFTTNLDMNCTADKEQYAEYDNVKIKCLLKNIGNAIITDLNMCMEENCEKINMDIAETKEFNYNTKLTAGLNQISIFAENTETAKSSIMEINVFDKPEITFENINHPKSVKYDDKFVMEFTAKKKSMSKPKNAVIKLKINSLSQKFNIVQMNTDEVFKIDMKGSDLKEGNNDIGISAKYEDINGLKYEARKESSMALEEATFGQGLVLFFKNIGNSVAGIFG